MPKVGSKLRETREAKNLTLKDVEQATNIRRKYLEALEAGEYEVLPGEVYVKGFIRNYSECLGLNPEELLALYKNENSPLKLEEQIDNSRSEIKEKKQNEGSFKAKIHQERQNNYLVYFVVVVVLALGIYFGLEMFSPKEKSQLATQAETIVLEKKTEQVLSKPVQEQKTVTSTATKNQGLTLEVQASRRCWVFVVADGKKIYEGILEKDAKISWQAREKLSVKLGDATALKLELNKKAVALKAKDGEVIEKEFTVKDI